MGYNEKEWQERVAYRMDLSGYLVHLTKASVINGVHHSALDILIKILRERTLIGSTTDSGFIIGDCPAVCLFDAPLYSICENLHYEFNRRMSKGHSRVKYDSYGLMLPKPYVFRGGGRPVIYDKTDDAKQYLPRDKWWRIVNLNYDDPANYVDWGHEREWRFPQSMTFHIEQVIVLVPNSTAYKQFYSKGAVGGENITGLVSCVIPIWQQYL